MLAGSLEIELLTNMARLSQDMNGARQSVGTAMNSIERSVASAKNAIDGAMAGIAQAINKAKAALGGLGVAQVLALTDEYTKYTAQLRLATTGQTDFVTSQNEVRRIATISQSALAATGVLYARIANGTRELGLASNKTAQLTEVATLAMKVSGATTSEQASAMLQLSQAFASGTLRGEEFNAVNEAAPRLMKALADGMGVPVGALKDMASEGKITSAVMAEALPKALSALREEAKQVQTIGGAFTVFKNNALEFVGVQAQANNTVGLFTSGIKLLSDNLLILSSAATGYATTKLAEVLLNATVATAKGIGGTILYGEALTAQRVAAVGAAQAEIAAAAATSARLVVTGGALVVSRQEATAALISANATIASSQAQIVAARSAGALSFALALVRDGEIALTAAMQARAVATAELALLGQQQARVSAQVTAATAAQTTAELALTAAKGAGGAAAGLAARALGFLGGPIGLITTLLGLGATAWLWWSSSAKSAESTATNAVLQSTDDILSGLNKQIEKLRERNALAGVTGMQGIAKSGGDGAERLALLNKEIANLQAGKSADGSAPPQEVTRVAVLQAKLREFGVLTAAVQELNSQTEQYNVTTQKISRSDWLAKNEKYASTQEKISIEIEKTKKLLGDAYSPEVEKRIRDTLTAADSKKGAKATNKELSEQAKLMLELSGLTGSFLKDWDDLSAVYAKGGRSVQWLTEQQAILLAKQPGIKKAAEDHIKVMQAEADAARELADELGAAYVAESKAREQGRQAVSDYSKAIDDSNSLLALELSLFGRSERYRATAIAQYQIELDLKKQLDAINSNQGFDQAQRDEETTRARTAAARAGAAAVERAGLDENIRILQSIDSTAHDVFVNVFDTGANVFKRLGQTIKASVLDLLYQITLKKWVVSVAASVTGAGATSQALAAAAGGDSGGGMLGTLSNLSTLNTLGSVISNGLAGTVGSSVGAIFGTMAGNTALGTTLGLGASSSLAAASAASVAGGGAAAGGALTGATAALAAIPVWGWAALAVMAVATMFGGKGEKEFTTSGVEGKFNADGFSGNRFSNWTQDGGWFSSDGDGRDMSGLDSATTKQFTDAYKAVQAAASKSATALGLSADTIASYSEEISVILTGDAAKDQEIITKLFADLGNHMAMAVAPGLFVYAKEGEGASATLDRLATSLQSANVLLELLGQRVFDLSLAGGNAASKLADAFGGLDKLAAAADAYYDLYFSDAERLADSQVAMGKALEGVNLKLPTSKEGFRALTESLNLNTDAGRAAYATLLTIAPQFAAAADAVAKNAAEAASKLFKGFTRNAVIDMEALAAALKNADIDTFAEAVSLVFENLAERIKSVLDSIVSERDAVAQARDRILDPAAMTKVEIERAIAGINLNGPGNAALLAAQGTLSGADAEVARRAASLAQAQAATPDRSALDAAAGNVGAAASATAAAQAWVDRYKNDWSGKFASWVDEAMAGNFADYLPNPSGERNAQNWVRELRAAQERQQAAQVAYDTALAAYNSNLGTVLQPVAEQQEALNAATKAQAEAAAAARAAQLAYISSLQDFTIDAGKSVTKLGKLREETLKYYEAQKQLADLMGASAAGLREAVRTTRMGQLDSHQSLTQQQGDFAKAYAMALSTEGATKASYADKLAAGLPDLSKALADTSSTRAEWALATAKLFAQSSTIADQLEATAPKDYAAESLALLQTIDTTLAALEASTMSAEKIIADAVAAGSEKTAAGLRAVIAAMTGQSIPAFASGGLHSGGVRLVGENGPEWEATGPSRIYNRDQMRAVMGGGDADGSALLEEMRGLRDETRAIAINTGKMSRTLTNVTRNGQSIATTVEES